jgi:4-hydroxy-2-oxoheptanedioate aldolase
MLDHASEIEDRPICCLLVDTRDTVETIDAICAVERIDLLVPAMFDHPDPLVAMAKVEKAAQAAGLPLGNVGLTEARAQGLSARD